VALVLQGSSGQGEIPTLYRQIGQWMIGAALLLWLTVTPPAFLTALARSAALP